MTSVDTETVKAAVRETYGRIASEQRTSGSSSIAAKRSSGWSSAPSCPTCLSQVARPLSKGIDRRRTGEQVFWPAGHGHTTPCTPQWPSSRVSRRG